MAARHRDDNSGGGFVMGLVTGSLLGAALAVLFAPKPGSDMRQDLASGAEEFGRVARDKWQDVTATAASAADQGREVYEQARETVQKTAASVGESADRLKDTAKDTASDVAASAASSASTAKAAVKSRDPR
jgi:gas vesicle protein